MNEILIVGASRGLGLAMAERFASLGWNVTGTVRSGGTGLHALAERGGGRVRVETLDMLRSDQAAALRQRLDGRRLDVMFVSAGITNAEPMRPIGEVGDDEFNRVMLTNALAPMRLVERFAALVPADGVIGVMSSGQGSVANNETGRRELYRGSKAALNMFMRSFAARDAAGGRAMVLMAPGWVRTELGGPDAPLGIDDSVPKLVEVLLAQRGRPGLRYLDYRGRTVPW